MRSIVNTLKYFAEWPFTDTLLFRKYQLRIHFLQGEQQKKKEQYINKNNLYENINIRRSVRVEIQFNIDIGK